MSLRTRALDGAASVWGALPRAVRRSVVHASNDRFPVGAVGIIRDDRDRVLLLEHRFRAPWPWGLPGGFLRHGETPQGGLMREMMEELDLEIEVEQEIFDTEVNVSMCHVSMTLIARARRLELSLSGEVSRSGFFGPDDLPRGTYPYHALVLRRFWTRLSEDAALRANTQAT